MSAYSPENFAEWLDDAFKKSSFKSLAELADKVGLSRATVSSYASARPQTVSNKPSRPKRENVIKIAEALNQEVNRALLITGHASIAQTLDTYSHVLPTIQEIAVDKLSEMLY